MWRIQSLPLQQVPGPLQPPAEPQGLWGWRVSLLPFRPQGLCMRLPSSQQRGGAQML